MTPASIVCDRRGETLLRRAAAEWDKQKGYGVRLKSLREKIPRKRASVSDARKCKSKNYYLKETCAVRFMSTTFRNTVLPSLSSQTAAAAFHEASSMVIMVTPLLRGHPTMLLCYFRY